MTIHSSFKLQPLAPGPLPTSTCCTCTLRLFLLSLLLLAAPPSVVDRLSSSSPQCPSAGPGVVATGSDLEGSSFCQTSEDEAQAIPSWCLFAFLTIILGNLCVAASKGVTIAYLTASCGTNATFTVIAARNAVCWERHGVSPVVTGSPAPAPSNVTTSGWNFGVSALSRDMPVSTSASGCIPCACQLDNWLHCGDCDHRGDSDPSKLLTVAFTQAVRGVSFFTAGSELEQSANISGNMSNGALVAYHSVVQSAKNTAFRTWQYSTISAVLACIAVVGPLCCCSAANPGAFLIGGVSLFIPGLCQ